MQAGGGVSARLDSNIMLSQDAFSVVDAGVRESANGFKRAVIMADNMYLTA